MDTHGMDEKTIGSTLYDLKSKDTPYERVLSSMCTYPHPVAVAAHQQFIETNLGDPGLFAGTAEIEHEVVRMMGTLFGNPDAHGYVTTGGTESNIQAIHAIKTARKVRDPNIIVPASAHFSFDKVADILGIDVLKADLDPEFRADISSVEDLINETTIGIVGIAGTTEFGQIDPIKELSDLALSKNIFLHVDAAFGGFVIPFLTEKYEFDFTLPGVTSIGADPHKMGFATIPSGGLLFQDSSYLNRLSVDTPYLTVNSQQTLSGTRSGASAASAYAVFKHLGRTGYERIVQRCMELTYELVARASESGIEPLIDPVTNVLVLDVPDADSVRSALKKRGWDVSITRDPRALRLVIMPHISSENLNLFADDLADVVKWMSAN
uniref:Probable L-tyrosine/L-aspartate decarboxylase n=1 Tax=Candidatus Methanogaster sp. ANME-2c ERB4 TaxID=2759911 RepID=A0A7G9YMG4_9EURY|nr:L-tyrosine/L-aspartate decarboxylase [Methanosarcinales archaeon ANME-2c ERB4]